MNLTASLALHATTVALLYFGRERAEGFASNPRRFHAQCFRTEARTCLRPRAKLGCHYVCWVEESWGGGGEPHGF